MGAPSESAAFNFCTKLLTEAYFFIPDPDGSDRACLAALVAGAVQPLAPLGFTFGRVAAVSAEYVVGLLPARGGQSRLYRVRLRPGRAVTRRWPCLCT